MRESAGAVAAQTPEARWTPLETVGSCRKLLEAAGNSYKRSLSSCRWPSVAVRPPAKPGALK
eukprot:15465382-Alexandrium_andersonii.AAC.1